MALRLGELSEAELEILKVFWEQGPQTVRQLHEWFAARGKSWVYTTVLTLVSRLEAKGYVTSDKTSVAHVFRPVVSRERLLKKRLSDLAEQLCDGTATPLVHALVKGRRLSVEEAADFRRLLDDLEAERETGKRKRDRRREG